MDDLELAVKLVNTVYALADPPDSLTDVSRYRHELVRLGEPGLAAELTAADLEPLRMLRERLRGVFHAGTPAEAAVLLNGLVREANAVPQLLPDGRGGARIDWGSDRHGYSALAARLPGALVSFVADKGVRRLGICAAAPCECVFVDRTRPGNRRFCCDACNDRAAAAAYRDRRRAG
ncbi:CGNR zinc finger domain-containing protein [Kitasatospora sp. NPDC051914]|uniref:CGNR zinc finger domain-containing protein n=1 Tax=unclassified Kitasatospora TaxID=2633591 RepID=UPI0034278BE5